MLFDLRSAGRRRTVKAVYLGLALLMFMGFVFFGIGSSGLSGSIGDLFSSNTGGGDNAAQTRLVAQVQSAKVKANATPNDPAAWAALAQARVRLAGLNVDRSSATGDFTAEGKRQLTAAGAAWDKYIALNPPKPDERLARQMISAFLTLNKADEAVSAQEIVADADPTQQTFSNLAILAYQANQTRKGDLAANKAVDLAPTAAEKKTLKSTLASAKSQAQLSALQNAAPSPTPTLG